MSSDIVKRHTPIVLEDDIISDLMDGFILKPVYIVDRDHRAMGLTYRYGFVLVDDESIKKAYVKRIVSVDHIFVDNRDLGAVVGNVERMIFNGEEVIASVGTLEKNKCLVIITDKGIEESICEMSIGFVSKRNYLFSNIQLGLSGIHVIALVDIIEEKYGSIGPSLLFIEEPGKGFKVERLHEARVAGWNGIYYSVWDFDVRRNKVTLYIIRNGKMEKYVFTRDKLPRRFFSENSIVGIYRRNLLLSDGETIVLFNLLSRETVWRRRYPSKIIVATPPDEFSKFVVYNGADIELLDINNGEVIWSYKVKPINALGMSNKYIVAGSNETLYVFSLETHSLIGKYRILGNVRAVAVLGERVLVGYISPADTPKALVIDYTDSIPLSFRNIRLYSGGKTCFTLGDITPCVKILSSSSKNFSIKSIGSKIIISDRGSQPGKHWIRLLVSISGFLPLLERIKIDIVKPEKIFSKINLNPTLKRDHAGYYMLLNVGLEVNSRVFYAVLRSIDDSLYGSSYEIRELPQGEYSIPIRILWARRGIRHARLLLYLRTNISPYIEEKEVDVNIDIDVAEPVLRMYSDFLYLWVPYPFDDVELVFEGSGKKYSTITSLGRGWNKFSSIGFEPDKVIIYSGGKRMVVYRERLFRR